jgi:CrcB protein
MTALMVFLGAAIGAPLRYLTDRAVQARHDSAFPLGTLTVNVVGSLVLGGLAGAGSALPGTAIALLGTGFCGGLTTYSTFSYETFRLLERKAYLFAGLNVLVSIVAGVGAAVLGYTVLA